jgi:two-component sensor histidine kinase
VQRIDVDVGAFGFDWLFSTMRLAWLSVFLTFSMYALGQDAPYRIYTIQDGLAQMKVSAILLDKRGFLWIGTRNGLNRFDGETFTLYSTADSLTNNRILALEEAPGGELIILTAGGLHFFDGARFTVYPHTFSSVNYEMEYLADSSVWILDNRDLATWKFADEQYMMVRKWEGPCNMILDRSAMELCFIGSNRIEVLWPANAIRVEEFQTTFFPRPYGDVGNHSIHSSRGTPTVFYGYQDKVLSPIAEFDQNRITDIIPNGLWVYYRNTLYLPSNGVGRTTIPDVFNNVEDVLVDPASQFWIASDNGLGRVFSPMFEHVPYNQLPNVWSIIEDHHGDMWFATYGNGLYHMPEDVQSPNQVDPNGPESWRECFLGAVETQDHKLHFANALGIVTINPDSTLPEYNSSPTVFTLYFDTLTNTLAEGVLGGINTTVYPDGTTKYWGPEEGVHPNDYIQCIGGDVNNCYWLGSYTGVTRICPEDNSVTAYTQEQGTLPSQGVFALCIDPEGRLWMGGDQGLLYCDSDNFNIQELQSAVLHEMVKSILVLDSTHLLIGAKTGLYVFDFKTFGETGAIDILPLNASVGYTGIEPGFNGLYRDSRGVIWITSATGVDKLYPDRLNLTRQQMRPQFTHFDGNALPFDYEAHTFQLDYGKVAVLFEYTAVGTVRPHQTQYQYRLDDGTWSEWSEKASLLLTGLSNGSHVLSVRVGPSDVPIHSAPTASLRFQVSLLLYQRAFFLPIVIVLLALLFGFALYSILRQRLARKRFAAQQSESRYLRSQLLLAELNPHFIFNVLASIQNKVLTGRKEDASAYIVKLSRLIRNFLNASYRSNEGHGQDYDIPLNTEIELLTAYIEFEHDKSDQHFRFQMTVDPALQDTNATLPPMLIQPFVENAIKHGLLPGPHSGLLEIHFSRTDHSLTCCVRDNGIGRTEAARRAKHAFQTHRSLGTRMIEERIELLNQLGHHISVETADVEPTGTEVTIAIFDS